MKNPKVKSDPQRAIAFRDFVSNHTKYKISSPGKTQKEWRVAWTKTSKAGLEFQAKRRRGSRIHFVLDGLDYVRVLSQKPVPGAIAKVRITVPEDITSAEIRWLFRNRNDADVRGALVFWRNGVTTAAPWDMAGHREMFANFLYTRDQILADERESGFRTALRELKAALIIQRAIHKRKGTHYVRVGETMQGIAQTYNISVENLKTWNLGLSPDNFMPGVILTVRFAAAIKAQI